MLKAQSANIAGKGRDFNLDKLTFLIVLKISSLKHELQVFIFYLCQHIEQFLNY